jgi:phosphoglycerate dehydrogenase-like enzyme
MAEIIFDPEKKDIDRVIGEIEILFGYLKSEQIRMAKNLKWIHLATAGVDMIWFPEVIERDIIITCSKGIHQHNMTEVLFGMILTLTRRFREMNENQRRKIWDMKIARKFESLYGKTIGILGLGFVGREIAKVSKAFGMKVIGMKRTPGKVDYVDKVVTRSELSYLLENSDFIVAVLPLTEETYHLIGEEEFNLMKRKPYFFNIGRGSVVDENALINALREGKIKGAGLDVFESEPLPQDSPLWKMDNVIITPHISGLFPNYYEKPTEIFIENFKRYIHGEKLLNVVDREKGY